MYDPELLQAIRHEVVAFAGLTELSAHLHFVEAERLQAHLERLYLGGELIAAARFVDGRLEIDVEGLTLFGIENLSAYDRSVER